MAAKYRPISPEEINVLTLQGCTCTDWSKVEVDNGFDPARVRLSHLSGQVKLGVFEKEVCFAGGLKRPAGVFNATLHNCQVGNNVYINHVRNYIANYSIEENALIDNIDLLVVEGESCFGNGVEVSVVNEAGGREIPIFDHLCAQTAYVIAFYRHRPRLIETLRKMIGDYTESVRSTMGVIGKGARLVNCRIIKDVKVGPAAVIEGVNRLENGSVNSCPEDPVYIGPGVFAEDFICCSGSQVTDGVIIGKCFIGQGTVLSKQYSAENSVFFANCGGFHGEACAIFAGPYTVTHHKSTLLIAGLFSFLNAGSGTNQSNHMYKLGPVHQGVVERGSKTASDSYMLWPAKVGAFTVVMGRHYKNSDTSDLPFSYLIEHEDESVLVPGVNLRSVGTVRDARKWPKRDKRKAPRKFDRINFKLLSPYTVQKMLNGRDLLERLKGTSGANTEYFTYNNVRIKRASLEHGIELYQTGIDKYIGNCLLKRLENKAFKSVDELRAALKPEAQAGQGKWLDLAGMFTPEEAVEKVLDDIESGKIDRLEKVAEAFDSLHSHYGEYEWAWAARVLLERLGKSIATVTGTDIIEMSRRWMAAVVGLDRILAQDARKEFTAAAQIGYGVDGDETAKDGDFAAVRGRYEKDSFVCEIQKHIEAKTAMGEELIGRMEKIC